MPGRDPPAHSMQPSCIMGLVEGQGTYKHWSGLQPSCWGTILPQGWGIYLCTHSRMVLIWIATRGKREKGNWRDVGWGDNVEPVWCMPYWHAVCHWLWTRIFYLLSDICFVSCLSKKHPAEQHNWVAIYFEVAARGLKDAALRFPWAFSSLSTWGIAVGRRP